jgi:hypothetical protein
MSILEVELSGPNLVCRTQLPDDMAIEDLLPTMATLVGDAPAASSRWMVATVNPGPLSMPTSRSPTSGWSPATSFTWPAGSPQPNPLPRERPVTHGPLPTRRFHLPDRVSTARRIGASLGALLGTVATAGTVDAPPLRRAFDMWHWTDRRRRLEWLIRRGRLERSTSLGVVGLDASGAETAIGLAEVLSAMRADRVVLVDGDPIRAMATRLVPGRHPSITEVAAGLADVDARFTPTRLVGVDLGQPSPPTQQEYRRALERIRRSAGLVVIDCGPAASAPLAVLCDQLVVVRRRLGEHMTGDLAHRTTVTALTGPPDGEDRSALKRSGLTGVVNLTEKDAQLELAAMLMSRIAQTGD